MLFIGYIAHCILFLKKKTNLIIVIKKEKNTLFSALTEPVIELE